MVRGKNKRQASRSASPSSRANKSTRTSISTSSASTAAAPAANSDGGRLAAVASNAPQTRSDRQPSVIEIPDDDASLELNDEDDEDEERESSESELSKQIHCILSYA